jgi:hypothetical protein
MTVVGHFRSCAFCVLASLAVADAAAQPGDAPSEAAPRTVTAVRLAPGERIVLDGVFEEPVWQRAAPAADFVQQDPITAPGRPSGPRCGSPSRATRSTWR